jgi:hypothetical protein
LNDNIFGIVSGDKVHSLGYLKFGFEGYFNLTYLATPFKGRSPIPLEILKVWLLVG